MEKPSNSCASDSDSSSTSSDSEPPSLSVTHSGAIALGIVGQTSLSTAVVAVSVNPTLVREPLSSIMKRPKTNTTTVEHPATTMNGLVQEEFQMQLPSNLTTNTSKSVLLNLDTEALTKSTALFSVKTVSGPPAISETI
ncbi:unnamed protein product, partial [Protopolystoma xenopodis]